MRPRPGHHRSDLVHIARQAMIDHGLLPDFDAATLSQVEAMNGAVEALDGVPRARVPGAVDLTALPWCSIDNDDSRDLDQLTVGEELDGGAARVRVAIADVDCARRQGLGDRRHARHNTTSVYTPRASSRCCPSGSPPTSPRSTRTRTRLAVVVEMVVARRRGRRARRSSARWCATTPSSPTTRSPPGSTATGRCRPRLPRCAGLDDNLRLQDRVAHDLRARAPRARRARPRDDRGAPGVRRRGRRRPARRAAEPRQAAHRGLHDRGQRRHRALPRRSSGVASLRRVVRSPERWQRIVEVAAEHGETLPAEPDARALAGLPATAEEGRPASASPTSRWRSSS